MFDIGFTELLVIAVVALLVLGPERLPKAARFAGLWVRRGRAQWASVRSELERELAADELKRSLRETQDAMRDIDASVREADAQARREFDAMRSATKALDAEAATGEAGEAPPAVTPTDRRDTPGYEPEPDDASGEAPDERA
ncbi:Sec-independent protein translocase protein TatB [Luteimonas soli]|uniref:Sec-independent protein translocase protein TatB n=1 Tax=Luteimonas soli TaxID=1648966 RepID=A0ABV7XJQ4_9GAMM